MRRDPRYTVFGIERPFPWLLVAIFAAPLMAVIGIGRALLG